MRFLILSVLFASLSLVSCGRRFDNIRKANLKTGREKPIQLVNNEVNVGIVQKVSLNIISGGHSRRKIQPICRGIDGCLRVCEYFDEPKCKQLSADEVVSFWLNKINSYESWEQAKNDLDLIATSLDVATFLKNVDKDNRVVHSLFGLNTSANCPINNDDAPEILFSYSPSASLYLKHPGGVKAERGESDQKVVSKRKKIIDGSVSPFDLQVFAGFIKSCFGHKSRTFSEMAVEIENKNAFEIGHTVLSKSCSENNECIRLAYCVINADLVWDKLPKDVKALGCKYENFTEMLLP